MDVIIKSIKNKRKLLVIILLMILLFSCKIKKFTKIDIKEHNLPDFILKKYEHYIYKNKKKYLYANINNAEFYEKDLKKIYCDKIFADIYDSDGVLITVVNSDKGVIDKNEKILTFIGNVYIEILENDAKLYCDELKLDYENNKLISDKEILLEKNNGSYIKADSMESDLKLEATKFENMRIKYYYDEDKK